MARADIAAARGVGATDARPTSTQALDAVGTMVAFGAVSNSV
jgi:hypothetical protein